MKLGIVLPQRALRPDALLGAARAAEEAGLDSIWVEDHLLGRPDPTRPVLEGWTALAAAAAVTRRVTVGTLVLRVGLRNPQVLVSMARTLNLISHGRLIVGLGIGDSSVLGEHRDHGIPFAAKARRVTELRRTIEMLKKALPQVPVWVGGSSKEILETLPLADGWNGWGLSEGFPQAADRAREAAGKPIEVSWGGMSRHFDTQILVSADAGHAIVAAGPANYQEKIDFLASKLKYPPGVS